LNFGGAMKGCLEMTVQVPDQTLKDERYIDLQKHKNIAYISWIGANPKCAINTKFPGGIATRNLIQTGMMYAIQNYKWIEYFTIVDNSTIKCGDGDDAIRISLPHISIALNGKTYYEKHLNARLQYGQDIYNDNIAKLFRKPANSVSFESFAEYLPHDLVKNAEFKSLYNTSETFIAFFNDLQKIYKERFCLITIGWLQKFIDDLLENEIYSIWSQRWIIDKKDVLNIDTKQTISNSRSTIQVQRVNSNDIPEQEKFVLMGGNRENKCTAYMGTYESCDI
jgi:hypothetical protein